MKFRLGEIPVHDKIQFFPSPRKFNDVTSNKLQLTSIKTQTLRKVSLITSHRNRPLRVGARLPPYSI
jgi:hypothetical protein